MYPGFLKKGGGEGNKPGGGLSSGKGSGDEITYSKVIEPIFRKHKCYDCHSSVNDKVREDLDFDKPETVEEVVKNGKLVKRLKDMGEDRMPPEGKGDRLSPSDIKKVEAWVAWKVKPDNSANGNKPEPKSGDQVFANTAGPVFERNRCFECHHTGKSGKAKADLDFANPKSLKGFVLPNAPGNFATAPIVLVLTPGAVEPMPPKGPAVSAADVEIIKAWIAAGAKF